MDERKYHVPKTYTDNLSDYKTDVSRLSDKSINADDMCIDEINGTVSNFPKVYKAHIPPNQVKINPKS